MQLTSLSRSGIVSEKQFYMVEKISLEVESKIRKEYQKCLLKLLLENSEENMIVYNRTRQALAASQNLPNNQQVETQDAFYERLLRQQLEAWDALTGLIQYYRDTELNSLLSECKRKYNISEVKLKE